MEGCDLNRFPDASHERNRTNLGGKTMSVKPIGNRTAISLTAASCTVLAALVSYAPVSHAFNFGNMMNPGRWMGGDRDRYDDRYDYPGAYGAPGFGYPYGGYAPG
jgi:hypothetical protein